MAKVGFFIYVKMDKIEKPLRTFYLNSCILYYNFHNEQTKQKQQSNLDDKCEESCKLERQFLKMQQNSIGSQWSCLRIGDARVYLLQFVTTLPSLF